jgi:hypothetical protein
MRWQGLAGGRAGSQAAAAAAHGGGGAGAARWRWQRGRVDAVEGSYVGAGDGAGAAKVSGERRRCASGELGHGGGETRGVRRG